MLRLHKQNTQSYEPFYKSLEDIDSNNEDLDSTANFFRQNSQSGSNLMLEKYSHLFQNLITFTQDLEELKTVKEFIEALKNSIRRLIPLKDADVFYFDEMFLRLSNLENRSTPFSDIMNHYYNEGILNLLFETKKPIILPELKSFNSNGPKLNYIIYPIYEDKTKKGIFVILTSINQQNFSEYDKHFVNTILSLSISKVDKILLKNKFNKYL